MTPQEAMAEALTKSGLSYEQPPEEDAARVLAALPEGWVLVDSSSRDDLRELVRTSQREWHEKRIKERREREKEKS